VTIVGVASLVAESIYLLVVVALGVPMEFFAALITRAMPGALYAIVIALICFSFVTKYLRKGMAIEPNTLKGMK